MKLSKLICLMAFVIAGATFAGCDFLPARPVYIGPDEAVEIAKPESLAVWVTNKETGKRELRTVEAQAGWWVGRLTPPTED